MTAPPRARHSRRDQPTRRRRQTSNRAMHVAILVAVLAVVGGLTAWEALRPPAERSLTVIAVEPRSDIDRVAADTRAQLADARERGADVAITGVFDGRDATLHRGSFFCEAGTNPRRCERTRATQAEEADAALADLLAASPPDQVDAFAAFRQTKDLVQSRDGGGPVRLLVNLTGRHDGDHVDLHSPGLADRVGDEVAAAKDASLFPDQCDGWTVHLVVPTSGDPAVDDARGRIFERLLADCGGELEAVTQRWAADGADLDALTAAAGGDEDGQRTYTLEKALFDVGSARLRPTARTVVERIADDIDAPDAATIAVHGYADATGPDEVNEPLSRRRAETVRDALAAALDVAADTIAARGHGSLPDDDTRQQRQAHRRVDIVVTTD